MPQVTYINVNNHKTPIEVPSGMTVMYGATINMVDGILAECGGAMTCATCHCYIHPDWIHLFDPPDEKELSKLAKVSHRKANSRLSCQLRVEDKHDGLVINLPETQIWSDG